ncbi:hypothetical protein ACFLWA_12555 [Chloroflexota bacterium]
MDPGRDHHVLWRWAGALDGQIQAYLLTRDVVGGVSLQPGDLKIRACRLDVEGIVVMVAGFASLGIKEDGIELDSQRSRERALLDKPL